MINYSIWPDKWLKGQHHEDHVCSLSTAGGNHTACRYCFFGGDCKAKVEGRPTWPVQSCKNHRTSKCSFCRQICIVIIVVIIIDSYNLLHNVLFSFVMMGVTKPMATLVLKSVCPATTLAASAPSLRISFNLALSLRTA